MCCAVRSGVQVMQPLTPTEEAELNKNTDSGFKKLLQKLKIASQDMQGGVNDRCACFSSHHCHNLSAFLSHMTYARSCDVWF